MIAAKPAPKKGRGKKSAKKEESPDEDVEKSDSLDPSLVSRPPGRKKIHKERSTKRY